MTASMMHYFFPGRKLLGNVCPYRPTHSFTYRCMISVYHISLIRCLDVNQQIVCCMPGIKRSTGINLNVEIWRRLERITSTPPGVKRAQASKMCRASNRGKTVCASPVKVVSIFSLKLVKFTSSICQNWRLLIWAPPSLIRSPKICSW